MSGNKSKFENAHQAALQVHQLNYGVSGKLREAYKYRPRSLKFLISFHFALVSSSFRTNKFSPLWGSTREIWIWPLVPGNPACGFAMKLGTIPCIAPSCLLESLNRAARSAISAASVVVRIKLQRLGILTLERQSDLEHPRTCFCVKTFNGDPKLTTLVKKLIKVFLIQGRSKERVSMHPRCQWL